MVAITAATLLRDGQIEIEIEKEGPAAGRSRRTEDTSRCMTVRMRIAMAADHAGYPLKQTLMAWLSSEGHQVVDFGTDSEEPVDYPFLCAAAARAVVDSRADVGIVLGGSGQGEAMAANKVHGVRAALCLDERTARLARQHNDANVLSMGARLISETDARAITLTFLTTAFEGRRHQPRLDQLAAIERQECQPADRDPS
jgi:ribose 5-phosphate isomerase B